MTDREARSKSALARLAALGAYAPDTRVLWYLSIRSEVETQAMVHDLLDTGHDLVIPYCVGRDLHLWALRDFDHLEPSRWGILEPREDLRADEAFSVAPESLDVVVVPGLAFTPAGDRLGYGAGYYDRLLARTEAQRFGVCFEVQVVPELPTSPADVPMHAIVTENRTIVV